MNNRSLLRGKFGKGLIQSSAKRVFICVAAELENRICFRGELPVILLARRTAMNQVDGQIVTLS